MNHDLETRNCESRGDKIESCHAAIIITSDHISELKNSKELSQTENKFPKSNWYTVSKISEEILKCLDLFDIYIISIRQWTFPKDDLNIVHCFYHLKKEGYVVPRMITSKLTLKMTL